MLYLDTSAFLKLLVDEEHSADLRAALPEQAVWSSMLLDVEAHRAARRLGLDVRAVRRALEFVTLVTVAEGTLASARTVGSDELRTLDALHLAAALELGDDLNGLVTYDRRLASAASAARVDVLTPGRSGEWWRSA